MADEMGYMDFDAQLPFSLEAEQSVLGAILIDPKSITEVGDVLKPEYFYVPQHKVIFGTLLHMFDLNNSIDFVTLLEKLKTVGAYDEAGGKTYLTQLAQAVPSAANITTYADIILEKFYVRSLIQASRQIIQDASEGAHDAGMLLDTAEQRIFEIRQGKDVTGLKHIRDVIQGETYDRLAKISNPETREDYVGISSGFSDLDHVTTGLNKSDLIIVGARPGVGKTSFALNIAAGVARSGKTVCFFSLEMTRDQLAQRLLSMEASIKSEKLRTGELTADEWTRLAQAGEHLSKMNLYFDETSAITVPQIKAKLRRMKRVDVAIVDYLGLVQASRQKENRVQEISEVTRQLKSMAKELKIPVLVCAQLNRESAKSSGGKRPTLTDLRESGSIEQDADIVLFIHRDSYYQTADDEPVDEHKAECIVAKNRHGETRTVELHWDGQYTRFTTRDVYHD